MRDAATEVEAAFAGLADQAGAPKLFGEGLQRADAAVGELVDGGDQPGIGDGEGPDFVAGKVVQEDALHGVADLQDFGAGGRADDDVFADRDDRQDVFFVAV